MEEYPHVHKPDHTVLCLICQRLAEGRKPDAI